MHTTIRILVICLTLAVPGLSLAAKPTLTEKMVGPPSATQVILVVEDTDILPARNPNDTTGASFDQIDLTKQHNVMKGYNNVYLDGDRLRDGELVKGQFDPAAPRTAYQILSASGPNDYALVSYYRVNRAQLENQCYYEQALVFRLKPGVINYIPKSLQPPLYTGQPLAPPDTAELKRVLARFPVSQMDIAVPDIVAIIKYTPDKLDRAMGGNKCSYKDDFVVLPESK